MDYQTIRFVPGPRVSTIVLNRPPLNIINLEMMAELEVAWDDVEGLESQISVITAAGAKAFSAGVEIADHAPASVKEMLSRFHRLIRRIVKSECVTLAAVHGHTLGGGAELAMVCDLVIAADNLRMGLPEISVGCFAPVAAAYLPRVIGQHRSAEMLMLGEAIPASEALRLGLVNRVVPRRALDRTVNKWVERILSRSGPVLALTRRALRQGAEFPFGEALKRTEDIYLKKLVKTRDMREGINAFLEKRRPGWTNS